jgi:hypothetical protein
MGWIIDNTVASFNDKDEVNHKFTLRKLMDKLPDQLKLLNNKKLENPGPTPTEYFHHGLHEDSIPDPFA